MKYTRRLWKNATYYVKYVGIGSVAFDPKYGFLNQT